MLEKVLIATALSALAGSVTAFALGWVWPRLRTWWRVKGKVSRAGLVMAVVVTASGLAVAEPAFAASSQSTATVVGAGYPICAVAHIYINNTTAYPHLDAYGQAQRAFYNSDGSWGGCGSPYLMSAYQLRTREDLYVNGGSGWRLCNAGPFVYNSGVASQVNTSWNPVPPPCVNHAWFFDSGYGGYYNAQWLGGWTQTPNAVYVTYP